MENRPIPEGAARIIKRYTGREVTSLLDDDVQALWAYLCAVMAIAERLRRKKKERSDSPELEIGSILG